MLAEGGHNITAVDFDEEAIGYATELLKKKNIYFVQGDILGNIFGKFDAVVSLDVIEHIPQSDEDRFMATVRDNLAGPGQCLIGTPNITAAQYASPRSAAGHVNLFDAERLASLVGRYFEQVFMFGMNDEVAHTGYFPMCHYLMALGTGKRSTTL
jgi:2-polyprenyl-3-methyl-5-hydroxy-6-metoxy-1,4-benzoquinol methylase